MQPRKSKLPLIIAIILAVVLIFSCGAVLIGAGLLAWLLPVRSTSNMSTDVPIEATVEATVAATVAATIEPNDQPPPASSLAGLPVYDVRVEIGVGSPIPVEVVASGEWPSTCSQLEKINIRYFAKQNVQVELLTGADTSACEAPAQGLPFSLRIPLNMVEMPAGRYSVNVNGVQSDFDWQYAPTDPEGHYPAEADPDTANLLPLSLADAHVEIGVGSPIPVELVVSGDWPSLCSQLARVNTAYVDNQFIVELLSSPAVQACPPDLVGLAFVFRIPLNMVAMQPGTYTVNVNGLQAQFDWPATSTPEPITPLPMRMAYIAADGNVTLVDFPETLPIAITTDATPLNSPDPLSVSYNDPLLSSDGKFLAYRRGQGVQQPGGMSMTFGLWIVDLAKFESTQIYDKSSAGFSWQPGTHLLAYIQELDPNYFTNRANPPNADLANPILGYDADTGETRTLVSPERGYAMVAPNWSPDGRFLGFDEVLYMEGRGPFAYYDFTNQEYVALEQPLGIYSWSADGETLAFDNLTYTALGDERIFLRSRQDGSVTEFTPAMDSGYAFMPTFSPQGDQIAYLANLSGPDGTLFTLMVQPFPRGDPVKLGEFENVYLLKWSPDGSRLVFSSGVWGEQTIVEVDLQSGASRELGKGLQPSLSPVP